VPNEIFLTTFFYDSLNRLQRRVDNIGQTFDYRYDSRNNLVAMADAQGPAGPTITRRAFSGGALTNNTTNRFGNVTFYSYDGINRKTREDVVLTASGQRDGVNVGADLFGVKGATPTPDRSQGGGDGLITIHYEYDSNSLLTSLIDDNGNQTEYTYDNLNRRLTETKGNCVPPTMADRCDPPTTTTYEYDPDDNVVRLTDENGSIIDYRFDAINRRTASQITRARGVVGTTAASSEYDGLSRLTRATDNNEPAIGSDDSVITFAYDSLSRVIEETQQVGSLPVKAISSSWRADGLPPGLIYPNGRIVDRTYDKLDRLDTIADQGAGQPLSDYDYIGTWRVAQRRYPINGTRRTYLNDAGTTDVGYDGLRRRVQLRHLRADNSLVVGFNHTYDRMNNKRIEEKLHATRDSELYRYDSAYRLVKFERGSLNPIRDAIAMPSANAPLHSDWTLDGVDNWQRVDGEMRQHSSFNEITQHSGSVVTTILHDNNGNETDDGTLVFRWDHANRLRTVTRKANGSLIAVYSYDAMGRRTRKVVTNSGAINGTTDFYYIGWRVLEERDGSDNLVRQYVYGVYIDEPLVLDKNLDGDDSAIGARDQRLFYHHNGHPSVYALTNTSGVIVEGYHYDAYGRQTVFEPGPNGVVDFGGDDVITAGGVTVLGNPYMFSGRRLDPETGMYYYRRRYYDPRLGRFLSRDPLLYHDNMNLFSSFVSNPGNLLDPLGERIRVATTAAGDDVNESFGASDLDNVEQAIQEICPCLIISVDRRTGSITTRDPRGPPPGRARPPRLSREQRNFCECYCANRAGCNLLWTLHTSGDTVIYEGELGEGNRHNTGRVTWNRGDMKGGRRESGGTRRPPSVGLAHELIHAYHRATNTRGANREQEEFNTVRGENQIRSEMQRRTNPGSERYRRLDPRVTYTFDTGEVPVPNPEGRDIDETDRFGCCCGGFEVREGSGRWSWHPTGAGGRIPQW
jgi:RHS repeat-associated protein